MHLKRIIISFFLLLTYTYGFAHNLVPHSGEQNGLSLTSSFSDNTMSGHEHHQHAASDLIDDNHSHVEHEDHFDEGFIDYLICLFNDVEHSESDCYMQTSPITGYNKSSPSNQDVQLLAVTFHLFNEIVFSALENENFYYSNTIFSPPRSKQHKLRGPPVYTC